MTQISWQYQVNNRAGGYIVTNTDWNDVAGDLRALIDQTTSSTTDNTPLPIGIDLVNDRVYISDPDSTTPEDGNHADTTLSVVGTTTLNGNTQQTGTFTVGVDDTGHDVKFFGATSGAYMLWDESDDELIIGGGAEVGIGVTAPTNQPLVVRPQTNDAVAINAIANTDGSDVGAVQIALNPYNSTSDTYVGTAIGAIEYDAADRRAHMAFFTRGSNSDAAPTERMRIDSSGHIHVNTTDFPGTDGMLNVMGSSTTRGIQMYQPTAVTTAGSIRGFSDVGGTQTSVYIIESNGDFQSATNSYGAISDERLKTTEPCRDYLDDLLALDVVNFQLTKRFVPTQVPVLDSDGNPVLDDDGQAVTEDHPTAGEFVDRDPADYSPKHLGLVAQQVEQHIPGLIKNDDYGVKSLRYSVLVPMLLQAVQTLTARIATLEAAA